MDKEKKVIIERIDIIRNWLKHKCRDALLVTNFTNVRYLSGFKGMDCWLLLTQHKNFFIGDFRYKLQATAELKDLYTIKITRDSILKLVIDIVRKNRLGSICFEERSLSVAEYNYFKKILGHKAKLIPTNNGVEIQRQIKTKEEIALIKTAVRITKQAFGRLMPFIRIGVSELFLKNKLESLIKNLGAQNTAFDTIVASGKNSAMPHARSTNKTIKANEPIIIDAGADFLGYKSDLTRTVFLGKIKQHFDYYKLVARAQDRARKLIRPLVKIQDIDRTARKVFKEAKLNQFFGHALGHGVGLDIHEAPYISGRNKEHLKAGMVFTIEPAIYIPGWGGIRIEDMVLVTKNGCEVL